MRVQTIINERRQVTEILEFEPLDDNTVLLNTAEDLWDIKLTGVDKASADNIANKLLSYGYADLSQYRAEYDVETETTYECQCPCGAEIELTEEDLERGYITCPKCDSELELDVEE